jgi:exopolyphosphatase / guanosine-5'-triphosphate,3'-diphosphate pyrophosphatase
MTATRPIVAAIDVGTNAVRLELARRLPDGSRQTLHSERDPVRPGEGVFKTGTMAAEVADRLIGALRRYAALCRRHQAEVRAVATSALREARNGRAILRRVERETGLRLEIISGTEEARLICLGVLEGRSPRVRSLCIDIGGGSTEVSRAVGEEPAELWSIALGAVRLTETFSDSGQDPAAQLALMREYAREAVERALPKRMTGLPRSALGSSGTIRAVVGFAAAEGTAHVTRRRLRGAVDELGTMGTAKLRKHFEPNRADIVVAGAVILEAIANHLRLDAITAIDRGLRHGVLVDLMRRGEGLGGDPALSEAALQLGRYFHFDEPHAEQVRRIAVRLFDQLRPLHDLPGSMRPYLEAAALLHDIGHAISYRQHHKHTYYLLNNVDIAGLSDHQREIVACIARFHRRSLPETTHALMAGLDVGERRLVRKLATLLRVADSLDRSHHQPVRDLGVRRARKSVTIVLQADAAVDLELWDVAREGRIFRQVFGRKLNVTVA